MDRCAVFVDAGYLYESARTLLLAGHPGAAVRANAVVLVREIAELAVAQTELPLLRIYWYAAAPNRNPYPAQRELASLGDIKLRLGNLRERADGRMVQKGVDAELHADMTGLARHNGAVDFVLLSGDEDMLRAVDEVQSYGVRVHLWGVEAGPDGGNQSLELIAAADRRHVLTEGWLRNTFSILEPPKPASPVQQPEGSADPGEQPEDGTDDDRPAIPKPTDLRPRPLAPRGGDSPYPNPAGRPGYGHTPDYAFHRLSDLTTQAEQDADAAEDGRTPADAITVGRVYARRWCSRATPESAAVLALEYPLIPHTIDAELLRYALSRGIDTWRSETDKNLARQGFWSVVRTEAPPSDAP